jgi:hypothetical protein
MYRIMLLTRRDCLHATVLQLSVLFFQDLYSLTHFQKPQRTSCNALLENTCISAPSLKCQCFICGMWEQSRGAEAARFTSCRNTEGGGVLGNCHRRGTKFLSPTFQNASKEFTHMGGYCLPLRFPS